MTRRREPPRKVFVYGAGKVGRALARALRDQGVSVTLRSARRGPPRARVEADVVVLAIRESGIPALARAWAARRLVGARAVVLHVSGALGIEPLAPLREVCAGVGQMHPMISFASTRVFPSLVGGNMLVRGDPAAALEARRIARRLGMTPRTVPRLDALAYHAAAGLVANGGAALAALGAELLEQGGVRRKVAVQMLGPLLRSVADNVERVGLPRALTGPVRRGDASAVGRHLATLRSRLPGAVDVYLALAAVQVRLARSIGEAPAEAFATIARAIDAARRA